MKTPLEWENEALNTPGVLTSDYRIAWEFIEAIQKDALSDPMAKITDQQELDMANERAANERIRGDQLYDEMMRMRNKWHETRRYLRAANKGAERNSIALDLCRRRCLDLLKRIQQPPTQP